METQDTRSPYVEHKGLKVIFVSDESFSIRWEKAKDKVTPTWRIRYVVGLKEADTPIDSWHIVAEEMDIDTFTFKELKPSTRYSCYVRAYDEAGNMTQYPGLDSYLTVTTRQYDRAPKHQDSNIKVTKTTPHSISIQWEKATDDVTEAKNLMYWIVIIEYEAEDRRWWRVHEEKDICTYTFTGLKADTLYGIQVEVIDEAGNINQYPNNTGYITECLLARTEHECPPTVKDKRIEVTEVKAHSISIKWEKATDDETLQKDLLYQVVLKEAGNHSPGTIICKDKGICAYTIRELKSNTAYCIEVDVIDEDGNGANYGGTIVTTLEDNSGDTMAPTVLDRQLRVTETTNQSITIRWDKATDETTSRSDILYRVGICNDDDPYDQWHIDCEGKDFNTHTFQNLKPGTAYSIFVKAYDEAGNVVQYPDQEAYLTVSTKKGDIQAPTATSKHLNVKDVTETSIAIDWKPAKDDVTQDKDIRYVVALTKADDKEDPWRIVHQGTGFHKFTFKDLKPGTRYSFFVMAFDEAGNMIQYPGLDRSVTVETLSW